MIDVVPPEKSFSVPTTELLNLIARFGQACNTELEKRPNILTRIHMPLSKCECSMKLLPLDGLHSNDAEPR